MESYVYYDCSLYRTSNRTMCSSHFTRDDVLIKIVERAVAQHVPHILVAEYVTEHIGVMEDRRDEIQSEIRELQEKSNRIGQWYENVFEHAESFDLPESVYMPNAQKMRKKQLDIQARCEELIDEDHKLARTQIVYKYFDLAEGAYILTLRYKSSGRGKVTVQTDLGESTAAIRPSDTWTAMELPCSFRSGIQPLTLHYQGSKEFAMQSFCLRRR